MSYARLAAGFPRWRHLVGVLVIVGAWFVVGAVVYGVAGGLPLGDRGRLAVDFLGVALLLPATWLGVRVRQGRRRARGAGASGDGGGQEREQERGRARGIGSLSSVAGHLRWDLLARCALPAAALAVLVNAAMIGMHPPDGPPAAVPDALRTVAALILIVPVQAAAEEYLFRGYLLQAFGSIHPRMPYAVCVLAQAILFAAVHGWGTPWGFADLVVFGVVCGWLTVRTGGLEAAIALHVLTNLSAVVLVAAGGDLRIDETAADLPWQIVAIDVPLLLLYGLVVARLAGRPSGAATAATAAPGVSRGQPGGKGSPTAGFAQIGAYRAERKGD